jgi:hypothetical protein
LPRAMNFRLLHGNTWVAFIRLVLLGYFRAHSLQNAYKLGTPRAGVNRIFLLPMPTMSTPRAHFRGGFVLATGLEPPGGPAGAWNGTCQVPCRFATARHRRDFAPIGCGKCQANRIGRPAASTTMTRHIIFRYLLGLAGTRFVDGGRQQTLRQKTASLPDRRPEWWAPPFLVFCLLSQSLLSLP